jgi:hypothetical protein
VNASVAEEALTLADAAERLGRSTQRVNQMLAKGQLRGPDVGTGRAAANIGRVWVSSVDEALARRAHRRPRAPDATLAQVLEDRIAALEARLASSSQTARPNSEVRRLTNSEAAAKEAAVHLKVAADMAETALQAERQRSRGLEAEVARLNALVEEYRQRAELAEAISREYGDGLTQLLAPGDAQDV